MSVSYILTQHRRSRRGGSGDRVRLAWARFVGQARSSASESEELSVFTFGVALIDQSLSLIRIRARLHCSARHRVYSHCAPMGQRGTEVWPVTLLCKCLLRNASEGIKIRC